MSTHTNKTAQFSSSSSNTLAQLYLLNTGEKIKQPKDKSKQNIEKIKQEAQRQIKTNCVPNNNVKIPNS